MDTPWYRTAPAPLLGAVLCTLLLLAPAVSTPVEAGEGTADDAYRAALTQEGAGNPAAARLAYERVLALDPEHRAARRALGYAEVDRTWLRGDALRRARGFVRHAGRWVTAEEVAEAAGSEPEMQARRTGEGQVGIGRALRGSEDETRVRALLARTVEDPDEEVRREAAAGLRAVGAPCTVRSLGRALWSRDATIRVRAAEALGRIGDVAAAPYLVARWEKRSGAFPRAVFTQIDQLAYIQDFDVEVAKTSFIADPLVGVLQEGVVLDVRIHATEQTVSTVERVAYATALRRISGQDHGHDVAAWRRWVDGLGR